MILNVESANKASDIKIHKINEKNEVHTGDAQKTYYRSKLNKSELILKK